MTRSPVFNPDFSEEALKTAETVRSEYVVEVKGLVKKRDPQTVNPKIANFFIFSPITKHKAQNP